MAGHTPWRQVKERRASVTLERQAAREAYRQAMRDAEWLTALRESRGVTQVEIAEALGVSQANVSKIERREDLYLSTLRAYVEALGGRLALTAVFPDQAMDLAAPMTTASGAGMDAGQPTGVGGTTRRQS